MEIGGSVSTARFFCFQFDHMGHHNIPAHRYCPHPNNPRSPHWYGIGGLPYDIRSTLEGRRHQCAFLWRCMGLEPYPCQEWKLRHQAQLTGFACDREFGDPKATRVEEDAFWACFTTCWAGLALHHKAAHFGLRRRCDVYNTPVSLWPTHPSHFV